MLSKKLLPAVILTLLLLVLTGVEMGKTYTAPISEQQKENAVDFCFGKDNSQTPPAFLKVSNFAPGMTADGTLAIKNCGTNASKYFGLSLSYEFTDYAADSTAEGFLSNISIEELKIGKGVKILNINFISYKDLLDKINDTNGNGYIDLYDLYIDPISIDYSIAPNGQETHYFYIRVKFIESAGNEYQGDRVNLTFTFSMG